MSLKSKKLNQKIGFIGCGNLGSAILSQIIRSRLAGEPKIFVSEKSSSKKTLLKKQFKKINISNSNLLVKNSDIIFLAVKPQSMKSVLLEISSSKTNLKNKFFISIAAGLEIKFFEYFLGKKTKIARVMPNLCLTVNEMSGAYSLNKNSTFKEQKIIQNLFSSSGLLLKVSEKKMHAITALSGSGPAFTAFFINAFCEAGLKEGLSKKEALLLAEQTFLGTSKLLLEKNIHPNKLIKMVASKGGTTEAGLKLLKKNNAGKTSGLAIHAAAKRSRQLSKS